MNPTIFEDSASESHQYPGAAYYPSRASVRAALRSGSVEPDRAGFLWHASSGCMVIVPRKVPASIEDHQSCDDLVAHMDEVQR